MDLSSYVQRLEESARGSFWDHLGAKMEALSPEGVVVTLDIQPHHLNLIGILHGGVHATLIDSAMGLAAMVMKPGESVVTTNLNLHYLTPVELGTLRVTAGVVHSTRKLVTTQAHAYHESGILCAFGTGTFRIIGGTNSK